MSPAAPLLHELHEAAAAFRLDALLQACTGPRRGVLLTPGQALDLADLLSRAALALAAPNPSKKEA